MEQQIIEIAKVYHDFLVDANQEDEKAVSAIELLFPEVDSNRVRNELFRLRQFALHYILFKRIHDESIADLIFQEVQSRTFKDGWKWDLDSQYDSMLSTKEYNEHFSNFHSEDEKLESIGLLFSERLLEKQIDPVVQLGKRVSMRNLAFINSTLDFAMENGMSFVSYYF
ncbi:hypothetical protein [Shimazuella kribbensis]|uniref:hypothetical protein n=1 Tax=Shimazuella kribbensis TaxID=139808 RepID=UPI0003FD2DA9|nr:hypothetical protein [Shimazuella kribbensis]